MASDTRIREFVAELPASSDMPHSFANRLHGSRGTMRWWRFLADACTCAALMFTVGAFHQVLRRQPFVSGWKSVWFSGATGLFAAYLLGKHGSGDRSRLPQRLRSTVTAVRVSLEFMILLIPGELLLRQEFPVRDAMLACAFFPLALSVQRHVLRPLQLDESQDLQEELLSHTLDAPQRLVYALLKRIFDIGVSSLLLLLLAPLLVFLAVLIRLTSRGPAIFAHERIGLRGAPFRIYKFRSMQWNSLRYERSPVSARDPRVTWVGRYLRRTSLDELPQLFNVLRGEMSLVGPRPEMRFIVDSYGEREQYRLSVTPGLTGLWQLSKDRCHPIHENLHHDLLYVRERSLSLDAAILIHTLVFAMGGGV